MSSPQVKFPGSRWSSISKDPPLPCLHPPPPPVLASSPQVKFPGSRWSSISKDAKDCIRAMLEVDPVNRPTAQQVGQI